MLPAGPAAVTWAGAPRGGEVGPRLSVGSSRVHGGRIVAVAGAGSSRSPGRLTPGLLLGGDAPRFASCLEHGLFRPQLAAMASGGSSWQSCGGRRACPEMPRCQCALHTARAVPFLWLSLMPPRRPGAAVPLGRAARPGIYRRLRPPPQQRRAPQLDFALTACAEPVTVP